MDNMSENSITEDNLTLVSRITAAKLSAAGVKDRFACIWAAYTLKHLEFEHPVCAQAIHEAFSECATLYSAAHALEDLGDPLHLHVVQEGRIYLHYTGPLSLAEVRSIVGAAYSVKKWHKGFAICKQELDSV